MNREALTKLGERLIALARARPPESIRASLLGIALLVFVVVMVLAVLRLPSFQLHGRWVLVAALAAMVTFTVNVGEFWLAARWLNVRVRAREAVQVSILASAANLAPIPGAILVRARDLFSRGAEGSEITRALATIGAAWVAVSLLVAGVSLYLAEQLAFSISALLLGVLVIFSLPLLVARSSSAALQVWQAVSVESFSVAAHAAAYFATYRALGFDAEKWQVLTLPLAGALSNASGFVPGGLGLRELLAGALVELVSLPASTGVIASAFDRILGLVVLAATAMTSILLTRFHFGRTLSGRSEE